MTLDRDNNKMLTLWVDATNTTTFYIPIKVHVGACLVGMNIGKITRRGKAREEYMNIVSDSRQ